MTARPFHPNILGRLDVGPVSAGRDQGDAGGSHQPRPNEIRITMPRRGGLCLLFVDHRSAADISYPDPFPADVHDAVRAPADCVSFPPAGARAAVHAEQSDSDRSGAGADIFPDAAGGSVDLHPGGEPLQAGQINAMDAVQRGTGPIHQFMVHYVREKDVALFVDLAKQQRPHDPNDLSMRVLVPAYILSELKAGFQIGAILFLPFMVIDMVVASITTSVGMLQLPPVVISTPLKLLLFVMVDGWGLLIGSLMRSFS